MNIIQDFIPKGRRNRPGHSMTPRYITIHNTGNTSRGAGALSHAKYVKGDHAASRPASWHFTVDDSYIVQSLPLNENGWHAGDRNGPGNRQSIGIEICQNSDNDYMKGQLKAARLCAYLIQSGMFGNKTVEDIVVMKQHWNWSGKNCPAVIRGKAGGWQEFINSIKVLLGGSPIQYRPVLKLGSQGEPVRQLQILLDKLGENLIPDGSFGPATESAVKRFQHNANILVDGSVGPQTWTAIDRALVELEKPKPQPVVEEPIAKLPPKIELPPEVDLPPKFEAPDLDRSIIRDNPDDWKDPYRIPQRPLPFFDPYRHSIITKINNTISKILNRAEERKVVSVNSIIGRLRKKRGR